MLFPEIIDIVIDHLHDDKRALLSCAIVSRSWLSSSRFHLFYKVRVDGERRHFRAFAKFLAETPVVCRLIRQLCLGTHPVYQYLPEMSQSLPRLSLRMLSYILSKLKCLKCLELAAVSLRDSQQPRPALSSTSGRISLHCLTFYFIPLRSDICQTLRRMFSLFSSIHQLDFLVHSDAASSLVSPVLDAPSTAHLRVAKLSARLGTGPADASTIIQMLRFALRIKSLRSFALHLDTASLDYLHTIGEFIEEASPKLHRLSFLIKTGRTQVPPEHWMALRLSSCSHLHSISFEFQTADYIHDLSHSRFRMMLDILAYVSRTIHHLSIGISVFTLHERVLETIIQMDWDRLQQTLHSFRGLQRVELTLRYIGELPFKELRDRLHPTGRAIIRKMPEEYERGLLKVRIMDPFATVME